MDYSESLNRHSAITRTVRRVLAARTRDVHLIEDVCQTVLLICWKKESALQDLPSEQVERYVVRVTHNLYYSWLRKRKPLGWLEGLEEALSNEDPALTVEKAEQEEKVLRLFDRLPPRYRDIARLHIVEGWMHERIATDKEIPVPTVKTRFRRAKALLAELVKRYFPN